MPPPWLERQKSPFCEKNYNYLLTLAIPYRITPHVKGNQANDEPRLKTMIQIDKNETIFPALRWVIKAMSTDPTREAIRCIHIGEDPHSWQVVATDGRRLHKATIPAAFRNDFAAGEFTVIKNVAREIVLAPSQSGLNFPAWRQVLPDYATTEHKATGTFKAEKGQCASLVTAHVNQAMPDQPVIGIADKLVKSEPCIYNDQFLADALGLGTLFNSKGGIVWGFEAVPVSPLALRSTDFHPDIPLQAVVMPMRA